MKRIKLMVALGFSFVLIACHQQPQKVCTLIGCESGLKLAFKEAVPERFSFTLTASDGETRQGECPSRTEDSSCLEKEIFVSQFTPDQVNLSLTLGEQTLTQSFTPDYTLLRPNGPDCDPECRQATITVAWGAIA